MVEYLGKYDYYLEKKSEGLSGKKYFSKISEKIATTSVSSAEERRLKKEREAEERRRVRLSEKLEMEISELEQKIAEIEQELCEPENMSNYELLTKLGASRDAALARLSEAYEEWEKTQTD